MPADTFNEEYEALRNMVEKSLASCLPGRSKLAEAMRYSLLAGGKRIRPVLALKFAEAVGGSAQKALSAALAVEVFHTYTLVHDDLPAMDNDSLRRGKPTNHVVYGEGLATLAGDALQAEAFRILLASDLPAETLVQMGNVLAKAAGADGVCLGQALDMDSEGKRLTLEEITTVHHLKTSTLLAAACQLGVLAGGGTSAQRVAAERYATALGLAFQIRDDMLDATGETARLGKPAGSDETNGKTTFVTLYGLDQCRTLVREMTGKAVDALRGYFENTGFFEALAIYLEERKY
ncbi:polyprenyl synthetase family protein [Oscillospiraceae bacterium CM]|nr:polyprenyl synthetase family protein [Oscillospiraceae bacterium CM]